MKAEEACACGSALKVHGIEGDPSIDAALKAWVHYHAGPGHEPVSNFEASRIRDRHTPRPNRWKAPSSRPTWSAPEESNA